MTSAAENAAADAGITLVEYRRRAAAGEKWCRAHRQWHPVTAFGTDPKGERGLARSCRASRRRSGQADDQPPRRRPATPRSIRDVRSAPTIPVLTPRVRDDAAAAARPVPWEQAACRHHDPELFFPTGTEGPAARQATAAAAVCASCPIREGCLRTALAQGEEFGVFGGLTEDQRRAASTGMQARAS